MPKEHEVEVDIAQTPLPSLLSVDLVAPSPWAKAQR